MDRQGGRRRILIVGGVAGGASFAARMRRLDEDAEIVMFEKGSYVSFANCGLPYHIGGTITDRDRLIVQTPEGFKSRYNVEVRTESEVLSVDTEKKEIEVSAGGSVYRERYDKLMVSPGAKPVKPDIKGIESSRVHTLRTLPDMDSIITRVEQDASRAVVIGGGFIGLETAENLRHRGIDVKIVELLDQVFTPADYEMASLLHSHIELNGVDLILSDGAERFSEDEKSIKTILKSGREIEADFVVMAIGVSPDTGFLKDSGIELGSRGAIVVNKRMETSVKDVYAAGDAVEVEDFISGKKILVPLAGPANRQGRIAADNIAGKDSEYKSTQGTAIAKVFDLTAGVTGLNEKNALEWGIPYIKSYTHSLNHAGYYPGAFQMTLKTLFEPGTGRVLGAQIIGTKGVDKRIDVFATAVRHGLSVTDLTELELGYAPPYGSAKDPVNMAGFVAENILEQRVEVFYPEDVDDAADDESKLLLDVRSEEEFESGAIPGAVNIPVDELRERIGEIESDKEVMIYCEVGLRGYLAYRILYSHGYRARNLSGGYKTWNALNSPDTGSSMLSPSESNTCTSPDSETGNTVSREIDACGLQCPGPVMQLKKAADEANTGQKILIKATDPGFAKDIPAWCSRTGNTLVSLEYDKGIHSAVVKKGEDRDSCSVPESDDSKGRTIVVFSNDFDKLMASFIIANGSASMGGEVTMFFTFWGLNLLRKDEHVRVKKSLMERAFGWMMPRGAKSTVLSKMNMGGIGTKLMQREMKKKRVMSLPELVDQARENGIKLVACTMSMDIMGIKKEELIDGVEYGGVGYYLSEAERSRLNLFI